MDTALEKLSIPPSDLLGLLATPAHPTGLVIFVHDSESGLVHERNQQVAAALREQGIATLLFDLLTPVEARDRQKVFDIALLASRLEDAVRWATHDERTQGLPLGLYGSGSGAAAVLTAASRAHINAAAIVCSGGRVDLAAPALPQVTAPTLLVVGADDTPVLDLNRQARSLLQAPSELLTVRGASHRFEEAGAMDEVVQLTTEWFARHLGAVGQPGGAQAGRAASRPAA